MVIDRGIGLAREDQQLVFDRFSQLVASDNRKAGGTGLGMNISKQIVDAHGGSIGYHSNVGPGTTFYFELDLVGPKFGNNIVKALLPESGRNIAAE